MPPPAFTGTPVSSGRASTTGISTPVTPQSPLTPVSTPQSEVTDDSLASLASVSTPSTRGRGRPRKTIKEPTLDDYPQDGTESEKERWFRAKTTERWRYQKLSSEDAEEFRKKENERVKAAYRKRKASKEEHSMDGVDKLSDDQETAKKVRVKEQNRKR